MCNLGEGIYLDGMKKQACDMADRMIADGDRFTDEEIARYTGIDAGAIRERREAGNWDFLLV